MPTHPARACSVPGCANMRPCSIHSGQGQRDSNRRRPPSDALYNTAQWRRLSKLVISEEPICYLCRSRPSTLAEHVIEVADGGAPLDRANLRGACVKCNVSKGQKAAQARRRREASRRESAHG